MKQLALLSLTLLGACAVGPDYRPPAPPTATQYAPNPVELSGQQLQPGARVPAEWWRAFGSPVLDQLVAEALAHSPTLAAAEASLAQSRYLYKQQRSSLFPTLGLGANYQIGNTGREASPILANNAASYSLITAGVTVSFNPDLFGGLRRGVEGARANAETARYQLAAARATIAGNVVATVIALAGLQAQHAAVEQAIAAQQASFTLAQRQASEGQIARADVDAFEAQLAATRALLPQIERSEAFARDQLAVFLGRSPDQAPSGLPGIDALTLPANLPLVVPAQLVETRPDIRAAAAQIHAATAAVGVATAARLPVFNLAAGGGGAAEVVQRLFRSENLFWNVVASVSAPILDAGGLRYGQRAARAGLDVAKANYRQAVLAGLQNVTDSLEAIAADGRAETALAEARAAAARSLSAARLQRQEGEIGALPLLAAQATDANAAQALANARTARLADSAALFVALGGGVAMDDPGAAPKGR